MSWREMSLTAFLVAFLSFCQAPLIDLRRLPVARLVARDAVQRMDVHEQHVAVLIDELDRLVRLAVLLDLHQPVETPHAVIDVHHVVARAQLVQLGDGHLLVAPDLAVDAVALVTVENLVVGVEAQLQVVVREPLVEGHRQRPHDGLSAADLVEDVLQPLDLRLVLRKNIGVVSPQGVADHVVGEHLEILVELRLRRRRKAHRRRGGPLRQVVAQQQEPRPRQIGQQAVAAGQQRIRLLGTLHVRERFAPHVVHPAQHVVRIVEPPCGLRPGELREGDARAAPRGVQVGDDLHAVEPVRRELARYVEPPDRIDLVAEEVQTVGFALRVGEDVHDAAAHGVLPGFIDEIHAREIRIGQLLLEHLDREAVPDAHGDRPAPQRLRIRDPFGQRLGIGADHQIARSGKTPQGVHRRRALHDALRILRTVGRRMLVGGGKEADALFVQQVVEVVHEVGRRVAVLGDEEVHAPRPRDRRGGIKRERPADQLLEMDDGTFAPVFAAQRAEGFRPGGELRQLLTDGHG